jgi:hypothetical protein
MRPHTWILNALFVCGVALGSAGCSCSDEDEATPSGTGGSAGTAGGGAGGDAGSAGGGSGGGGAGGSSGACSASIDSPTDGATLDETDDDNQDCSDGFTLDVTATVQGATGGATLYANGTEVAQATIGAGGDVTFTGVTLDPKGPSSLEVRADSTQGCAASIAVTVNCPGPSCSITLPDITNEHPELNGVPVADGGDRVSSAGAPYQTAFEVTTDAENGQQVILEVQGQTTGVSALVSGGVASFPGVTLDPDGDYTVQATCRAASGLETKSAQETYTVDTTPPELTVTEPSNGAHFGPADDVNGTAPGVQFRVCGTTTTADALDLPATLGPRQSNFGVAIGTSSPDTVPATTGGGAGGADGACIEVTCPGSAAFGLTVTLYDDAGNPNGQTVTGVTCAVSTPSVQIVDPVDGTGSDLDTHILHSSMGTLRVDSQPGTAGAQYTVRACTDQSAGTAELYTGLDGSALTPLTSSTVFTPASAGDGCPASLGYVVEFTDATLIDSTVDPSTLQLTKASELRVDVIAAGETGSSPEVRLWVDANLPLLQPATPSDLCTKLYQSLTPITTYVSLGAGAAPVTLTVTNAGLPTVYTAATLTGGGALAEFPAVTFGLGVNDVTATTTKPSGNTSNLVSPCTVTVGNPPVVNWIAPTQSSLLNVMPGNPAIDADLGTPGWQGGLLVGTDLAGEPSCSPCTVTFFAGATNLGTANVDAGTGQALLANVTVADGAAVALKAETNSVAGRGVGSATITVPVDTVMPAAPTALTAAVGAGASDRRQTTFHLSWTAPSDGGQPADGYRVRVSKTPISSQAEFDAAVDVSYAGTPAAPGASDGLDVADRIIETDYYFAIAATDDGGNVGPFTATASATRALFNKAVIQSPVAGAQPNADFGYAMDASSSVNGDAFSDLIVGSRTLTSVYIYFGSATGYPSAPDVEIQGGGPTFGFSVAVIGDVDDDGLDDIGIGQPFHNALTGRVVIFKGRASWPAVLTLADASYTVDPDKAGNPKWFFFGSSLARLGDFNADGADDFVVGANRYDGNKGAAVIVHGVNAPASFPASMVIGGPGALGDLGTRAILIEGTTTDGYFGDSVFGANALVGGGGHDLAVSEPGDGSTLAGKVHAFQGVATPASGVIALGAASASVTGSVGGQLGLPLASLGPFQGRTSLAAGEGFRYPPPVQGLAHIFFGDAVSPFTASAQTRTRSSSAEFGSDGWGNALCGSGFSGTSVTTNLIGNATGDLAISALLSDGVLPAKLHILRGEALQALAGGAATDVDPISDVILDLPPEFSGADGGGAHFSSTAIKDLNSDGYGDLAIAQATLDYGEPGRIWVLW